MWATSLPTPHFTPQLLFENTTPKIYHFAYLEFGLILFSLLYVIFNVKKQTRRWRDKTSLPFLLKANLKTVVERFHAVFVQTDRSEIFNKYITRIHFGCCCACAHINSTWGRLPLKLGLKSSEFTKLCWYKGE